MSLIIMSTVHPIQTKEVDRDYKCVQCRSASFSIIRDGDNPRLKCHACGFLYNGDDSIAAQDAGAMPEASADTLASAEDAETKDIADSFDGFADYPEPPKQYLAQTSRKIPRTPTHVFISKDRAEVEFTTKTHLKKTALKWESRESKYDLFELVSKKSVVKLDIS